MIRVSQICYGKWPAEGVFSVTNLGNLDRIRQDQGWLAEGGFSVTNLGNLDRIRHDQGCLAEGGFSVTNLGNLDRIGAEGTHAPAGRSHVAVGEAKRAGPPRRGLEGEPRSGSNF